MLLYLIIGGLAGFLVGKLFSGRGYGIVADVLLGLVGGAVGGWFFRDLLHWEVVGPLGWFVSAFLGASVIVAIVHAVRRAPV